MYFPSIATGALEKGRNDRATHEEAYLGALAGSGDEKDETEEIKQIALEQLFRNNTNCSAMLDC